MMTKEEAMNLVKQVLPCLNIDKKIREAFETLIPELKESDDERIRKWLIKQLSAIVNTQKAKSLDEEGYKMSIKAIAYLEKQKEQKSSIFPPNTVLVEDAIKFGSLEYERGVKNGIQSEKSRQWKPSEEELNLLRYLAKNIDVASHERHVLDNMIDRLMAV